MQDRNKIDDFVDQALSEFSNVSPRAGLEERILANLRQPESQRRWIWAWMAVPALGLILLFALLWKPAPQKVDVAKGARPRVTAQTEPPQVLQSKPPSVTRSREVQHERSRPIRSAPKPRDPQPRLATFPSQDGNDELIRLALRFAQTHPEVAGQVAKEQEEFRELAAAFTEPLSGEEQ